MIEEIDSEGSVVLFDYDNDQYYRISEKPTELGGKIYLIGIKKTVRPRET